MRLSPIANRFPLIFILAACLSLYARDTSASTYTASVLYQVSMPTGYIHEGPNSGAIGGQLVGIGNINPGGNYHALLWSSPTGALVDLNPTILTGITNSYGYNTNGAQQVGEGTGNFGGNISTHALLWSGTANSAVDLNPTILTGFTYSGALALDSTNQVGFGHGATGNVDHALLWSGTAASAVDLNPTNLNGFTFSNANGVSGNQEVGRGGSAPGANEHALLWTGTASSTVDLNPTNLTGFSFSNAAATSGNQQVGFGHGSATLNGNQTLDHALLWSGTAASAVDLNPTDLSGFVNSYAQGTNGTEQIGYDTQPSGNPHALLWFGTADSAIDLHSLLPANLPWSYSGAYAIDASGNVFGVAGGTTISNVSFEDAIEWSPAPVPEPVGLGLLALGGIVLRRRSRISLPRKKSAITIEH